MPALARKDQFDPSAPPPLHLITRCVRRTRLCGGRYQHRKVWIQNRLLFLSQHCAVGIAAYAVMSNHMHVVAIPRPWLVDAWSDEAVVRSALLVSKRLDDQGHPAGSLSEAAVQARLRQPAFIARWRRQLADVSWFMRLLNEPIARLANREDEVTGHFWEARFRSIPLLDQAALFSCMAYVDLNPVRAGLCESLETSDFTSIQDRLCAAAQRAPAKAADEAQLRSEVAAWQHEASATERASCLLSIEDCCGDPKDRMNWPPLDPDAYVELVRQTGAIIRSDKPGYLADQRLGGNDLLGQLDLDAQTWALTMRSPGSLAGRALGGAETLAKEVIRTGAQWIQRTSALFRCRPSLAGG
jgi:REP element-mobilizing transposase RayT